MRYSRRRFRKPQPKAVKISDNKTSIVGMEAIVRGKSNVIHTADGLRMTGKCPRCGISVIIPEGKKKVLSPCTECHGESKICGEHLKNLKRTKLMKKSTRFCFDVLPTRHHDFQQAK